MGEESYSKDIKQKMGRRSKARALPKGWGLVPFTHRISRGPIRC